MLPAWMRTITWDDTPVELSLRHECRGGDIREPPEERPTDRLARSRHPILLIHGFNVSLCAAGRSYDAFLKDMPFRWKARTFWVYWPGDAVAPGTAPSEPPDIISKAFSAASYPFQIRVAERSGEILAGFIKDAAEKRQRLTRPPIALSVVAHSLGCLLALELVSRLDWEIKTGKIRLDLLILMAAAVPQYLLAPGERYDVAKFRARKTLVYFSRNDDILELPFAAGQYWTSTNPASAYFGRAALGREGLAGRASHNVTEQQTRHGHGGYWPDRDIAWRLSEELDGTRRIRTTRFVDARPLGPKRELEGRHVSPRTIRKRTSRRDECCPA